MHMSTVLMEARRGTGSLGTGIRGSFELLAMGARDLIQILCKNDTCSYQQPTHLSSLRGIVFKNKQDRL